MAEKNSYHSIDIQTNITYIKGVGPRRSIALKKNGIETIECINKKFDPNYHQAMLEVEDNTKEPGIVVQEIQKGYMMKDRLLRPSLVGVAKKRDEKREKEEKK